MIFLRSSSLTRHGETAKLLTRSFAHSVPRTPPPFPVISTCPSLRCQCSSTPPNLDIDRERDLNGSMSPYAQHLLLSTGRMDWTSRIEDERDTASWGRLTSELKEMLGRRSEFHDVCCWEVPVPSIQAIGSQRRTLTYTKPAPELQ